MAFTEMCNIIDWIEFNNGYDYYKTYFNRFTNIQFLADGNSIVGIYKNFLILEMQLVARQIYLYAGGNKDVSTYYELKELDRIAQSKLIREYITCFNLNKGNFKVTRDNSVEIEKYLNTVKSKIDFGFEDFTQKLKEQKIDSENAVFFKIELNKTFTFSELSNLLLAYNQLYSFSCYVEMHGIESLEDIDNVDEDELWNSRELVLESLHIASPGILNGIASALDCAGKGADFVAKVENAKTAKLKHLNEKIDTDVHVIYSYDEALEKAKSIKNPKARAYMESHLKGLENYLDKNVGRPTFDERA